MEAGAPERPLPLPRPRPDMMLTRLMFDDGWRRDEERESEREIERGEGRIEREEMA